VTILWQQLYSYDYGVLNTLLNYNGNPFGAVACGRRMGDALHRDHGDWKNAGIYIILFLVGLPGYPDGTVRSASLDGAGVKEQSCISRFPC